MNAPPNETLPPKYDLPDLVRHSIDQAVVDGLVDGGERRVHLGFLAEVAFRGGEVPKPVFHEFRDRLPQDVRYINRVLQMYSFEPELSPDANVKASPLAIVDGFAICSEAERCEVMSFMDQLAESVYANSKRADGVLSLREVSGVLKSGKPNGLPYKDFKAFRRYMDYDPRFHLLPDGRIVLTERFKGNVDGIPEQVRIAAVPAAVEKALPHLAVDSGTFTEGSLLGAMKELGFYPPGAQFPEVFEALRLSKNVEVLDNGRFKLLIESEKSISAAEVSLEDRIRAALDGPDKGPQSKRPRRRGGRYFS